MKYNFTEFLNVDSNMILDDFLSKYTTCIYTKETDKDVSVIFTYYRDIIYIFKRIYR